MNLFPVINHSNIEVTFFLPGLLVKKKGYYENSSGFTII